MRHSLSYNRSDRVVSQNIVKCEELSSIGNKEHNSVNSWWTLTRWFWLAYQKTKGQSSCQNSSLTLLSPWSIVNKFSTSWVFTVVYIFSSLSSIYCSLIHEKKTLSCPDHLKDKMSLKAWHRLISDITWWHNFGDTYIDMYTLPWPHILHIQTSWAMAHLFSPTNMSMSTYVSNDASLASICWGKYRLI